MRPSLRRILFASVPLALAACLLAGTGGTAGDARVWKPLLPEADLRALVEQAAKGIQEELAAAAPTTTAAKKARGLAVMIAVYAQSDMTRPGAAAVHLAGVRDAAIRLADTIRQKKFAEAVKQAAALPSLKTPGPKGLVDLHKLSDRDDLTQITMQLFAVRTRGGLGLDSRPAKNVDGVEARIVALSRKPLAPADLEKQVEEIARVGYVSAMIGQVTHALAPEKDDGKKKRAEWVAWSEQMRDAGKQLAEAARAKNPKDVRAAAAKLNATCTSCHDVFRAGE